MFGNQNCFPGIFPLPDDFFQFADRTDIQIRGRLIQYKDCWLKHTDAGAGNLLFFAAGQLRHIFPEQLFHVKILHRFFKTTEYLRFFHADIFAGKYDLCVGKKRIKL